MFNGHFYPDYEFLFPICLVVFYPCLSTSFPKKIILAAEGFLLYLHLVLEKFELFAELCSHYVVF